MPTLLIVVVLAFVIAAVAGAVILLRRAEEDPFQDRLLEYGAREEPVSLEEVEMSLSFTDRILIPLVRGIANLVVRFTPQRTLEVTADRLEIAGLARRLSPGEFWAIRVAITIGLAGMIYFMMWRFNVQPGKRLMYSGGMLLLGYILPGMWLSASVSRRQLGIVRALPDALDLLTICVEAGLGFDSAMRRVADKWDSDLSFEFGRVLQEIQLGKKRRDALRNLSDRLQVPDITTFVAAVVQAEQLGVSMTKVLRIQSDQMRIKRRQLAEKKAQEAPVKMVIPMVFLIFPSLLLVLLGPALFQVLRSGVLEIM
ncbi:MAG: type II secretion system F family protein [Anaerolineales bacterium]|nr:type II secretion system F family protein [Anaerolineales bacterium]